VILLGSRFKVLQPSILELRAKFSCAARDLREKLFNDLLRICTLVAKETLRIDDDRFGSIGCAKLPG